MKAIPPDFAARLEAPATTFATCFTLTRRDGAVFGFTDHDRPLTVAGVVHEPAFGLDAGVQTVGPGLAAGGAEAVGILSSEALAAEDLARGLWDGARVEIRRVDWSAPEHALLLSRAEIGEVVREGGAFRAELRALAHLLDRPRGRVFSHLCDADLGDQRCGVDLDRPEFFVVATVLAGAEPERLSVEGAAAFADGWFSGGRLTVLGGPLAGETARVLRHVVDGGGVQVELLSPGLSAAPGAGTLVRLTAGCDKRFPTCRDRFQNALNFRGFPHMPGSDFVLAYPDRDTGENDGGVLVG